MRKNIPQELQEQTDLKRIYDPTPNRYKHRWKHNHAGFENYNGIIVGKCPNDISYDTAQELLMEAITDPPDEYSVYEYPKRLYNVFNGVIYRAEGDGYSKYYHAFPADNIDSLNTETLEKLKEIAIQKNCLKSFIRWKKRYAGNR